MFAKQGLVILKQISLKKLFLLVQSANEAQEYGKIVLISFPTFKNRVCYDL